MISGAMPAVPKVEMAVVDVRDLADAHLLAMTVPAAGQRYLTTSDVMTMLEMGEALRADLGSDAARAPRRTMPDRVLKIVARFKPELGALVPMLGRRLTASSDHAVADLGWTPRPVRETVVDTGKYLVAASSGNQQR